MCRFVLYMGPPVVLADLLTRPAHSLVNQSYHARLRKEPLNGDGFGMAWYSEMSREPALFRSLRPAWADPNLGEMARVTSSPAVLAHIRAASPGLEVSEVNCHPFTGGSLALVHNGSIGGFRAARRRLLAELSDEAFSRVRGTTDSEVLFAMLRDRLGPGTEGPRGGASLAEALTGVLGAMDGLSQETATRSFLNVAVTDGSSAVVSRYATGDAQAPSLFLRRFAALTCEDGVCRFGESGGPAGVMIASEPLDDAESWQEVPKRAMVVVEASGSEVEVRPL